MKAKSFLFNILFFILAITFTACTSESIENEVTTQENLAIDQDLLIAADKNEEEEPDDRDSN